MPVRTRLRSLGSALPIPAAVTVQQQRIEVEQALSSEDVLGQATLTEHIASMRDLVAGQVRPSSWTGGPDAAPATLADHAASMPVTGAASGSSAAALRPTGAAPLTLAEHVATMAGGARSTTAAQLGASGTADLTYRYSHHKLRQELITTAQQMNAVGINQGTSGNISARAGEFGMLITPSGISYDVMQPEQIVYIDLATAGYYGEHLPSSEWRFHLDIYNAYPDAQSILHAHSTYCTAVSALNVGIPAFHYMIASAGGKTIPCATYETFGTQPLSDSIITAMKREGVRGCLMANHGMICFDKTLAKVLGLAVEIESLARQYTLACSIGTPKMLSDAEMDIILAKFQTYGKQPADLAELMASSDFLNQHAIIPPGMFNLPFHLRALALR